MSVAVAPPPWPAGSAPGGHGWQFGREVWVDGPQGRRQAMQWVLRRNCSVTPGQLAGFYGVLCAISLGIALLFAWQGAPVVLAFAGLELLAVGAALLVFARHAGDRETLTLVGPQLLVEQQVGAELHRADFAVAYLRVEPAAGQGSLIMLSGQGCSLRVGRHLRPERREPFARELRRALRTASVLRHPDADCCAVSSAVSSAVPAVPVPGTAA